MKFIEHGKIFPNVREHYGNWRPVYIMQWYSFTTLIHLSPLQKQEYEEDQQKLKNKHHKKEHDQLMSEIDRLEKLMKDTKNALEEQQHKNSGMFLYLLVYISIHVAV